MNPVLLIAYNNLELTKNAVQSVLAQTIPVELYFVDNGSTDGTWDWINTQPIADAARRFKNESVVRVANCLISQILEKYPYLLSVPNDVRIPPNCYQELLRWPRGIVCASDIGRNEPEVRSSRAVSENTPIAVALTRKWAWDGLMTRDGYFLDENYFHYASDCDLALRLSICGIKGLQVDVPFWHYGSASHRLAPAAEAKAMTDQADRDRDYFERKWGFKVDSPEYSERWKDLNFGASR